MKQAPSKLPVVLCMALSWLSVAALAEKADRDKPVNLEADKITVDDINKVHQFEGNVQFIQGTLVIRAEKIVVTQDAAGFQKGVATGGADGLARFRQKREGKDEYVDGEADRIEHDDNSERTELFGHAWVRSGQDQVRGQYISFDGKTENYVVTDGPKGTVLPASNVAQRVHAVIQPRSQTVEKTSSRVVNPALKPAGDLSVPDHKLPAVQ